jgi:hypothetical protein
LGLQLAKTAQPGAEEFLRAATRLKPASHVAEGNIGRGWLWANAREIEARRSSDAYRAGGGAPTEGAEPHFAAGNASGAGK